MRGTGTIGGVAAGRHGMEVELKGGDDVQISLKAARVNAGLTIKAAAPKIGVGKDTLIKWEREPWRVNALFQQRISNTYSIPIDNINFLPSN